ncbi:hypothetical protein ABTP39_19495, partial [Acinetobacter baumannii]
VHLDLTEEAMRQIATAGYDPIYGARPLKRAIQRDVMNPLAQATLRGEIRDGSTVRVDFRDGEFLFKTVGATP